MDVSSLTSPDKEVQASVGLVFHAISRHSPDTAGSVMADLSLLSSWPFTPRPPRRVCGFEVGLCIKKSLFYYTLEDTECSTSSSVYSLNLTCSQCSFSMSLFA